MEADVVHVKCWHSQTFDPHSFCTFPVVVDVFKHIVCYTTFSCEHEASFIEHVNLSKINGMALIYMTDKNSDATLNWYILLTFFICNATHWVKLMLCIKI